MLEYELLYFSDNDSKKHGKSLNLQGKDYAVKAPSELLKGGFDKVFIASICGEDIYYQLKNDLKIPENKIDNSLISNYQAALNNFLSHFAKQVKEQGISGAVAELGVFQGDTAKRLNFHFKDKRLYLFDTFEGYASINLKDKKAKALGQGHLSNTSLELVAAKMPFLEQVVFKKGLFPATAEGLENERFCLVNLDPDLFEPVKAGLEFFYPRLERGGILIISGYFSPHTGPKLATDEFIKKHGLSLTPLGFGNVAAIIKER